jgi:hypothetical protein
VYIETEEIKQAYTHWKTAVMNADIACLDKICTENFSWTNKMGVTHTKTENLMKIGSRNLQYISWVNEDIAITMMEDIAMVKTRENLKMRVFNQRVDAVHEITIFFVNKNGSWLLAGGRETDVRVQ